MKNKMKKRSIVSLVACICLLASISMTGCSSTSSTETESATTTESTTTTESATTTESTTTTTETSSEPLNVVATTTMLYDLATVIGGDNVEAVGLMGVGIDPHLYTASAGDVTKVSDADVVVYNGIHLEAQMGEIFDSLDGQGKTVICIEYGIDPDDIMVDPEEPDSNDPHIWFDTTIWMQAATYMADCLAEADPDNADAYQSNLDAYMAELEELDAYISGRVAEVSEGQRVLVTAHDAFNYFGNAYGFEVMGLQGISTETEAGTADVSELAAFIAENEIKAIFVESSVSTKSIEALQAAVQALGFDVSIGGELYSDSLGDATTGHDTYITTCMANIDTIVDALK